MPRTDEIIKKDVLDHLTWDTRVDASRVEVRVENGTVLLEGMVPTPYSRLIAVTTAWSIPGVGQVSDCLTVERPPASPIPADEELKSDVESMLRLNAEIDETNIDLRVEDGEVTLDGSVPSLWNKIYVDELVSNALGVLAVHNRLAVVPETDVVDQAIADDLSEALQRSGFVEPDKVTVRVDNGEVTLMGHVRTQSARKIAREISERTLGVKAVRDELIAEFSN